MNASNSTTPFSFLSVKKIARAHLILKSELDTFYSVLSLICYTPSDLACTSRTPATAPATKGLAFSINPVSPKVFVSP